MYAPFSVFACSVYNWWWELMTKIFSSFQREFLCKNIVSLLAFWDILSILIGMASTSLFDPVLISLMCRRILNPVSIVGLISLLFLPLFISAVAVFSRSAFLIFLICGIRGFCFGYCVYSFIIAFGSAGWLISGFTMYSAILAQPILFWFWIRSLNGTISLRRDLWISSCLAVLIGCMDYFCVSPFLGTLVSNY